MKEKVWSDKAAMKAAMNNCMNLKPHLYSPLFGTTTRRLGEISVGEVVDSERYHILSLTL